GRGFAPTESERRLYAGVVNRIRLAVAAAFKVSNAESLRLTKPTFFSRLTSAEARTQHDEYWHSHVDKDTYGSFHYTSLLYLANYGTDFTGGRFLFLDSNGTSTAFVEPRTGRVSAFTSGSENTHRVERVTNGQRFALTIAFTCDPAAAIDATLKMPVAGGAKTPASAASSQPSKPRQQRKPSNNSSGSSSRAASTPMGNGAGLSSGGSRKVTLDGVAVPSAELAATVTRLRLERQRQADLLVEAEAANRELRRMVELQRQEMDGLRAEANKLKSVLDLTVGAEPELVTEALHAKTATTTAAATTTGGLGAAASARERLKKQGVSGESLDSQLGEIELRHHDKDERSKKLIRDAIVSNSLLQHMEPQQLDEMVACMYAKTVPPGCHVIRQGEKGQHLYVCSVTARVLIRVTTRVFIRVTARVFIRVTTRVLIKVTTRVLIRVTTRVLIKVTTRVLIRVTTRVLIRVTTRVLIRSAQPLRSHLVTEGRLEVTQDGKRLGAVGQGIAFGELALLYNCTRTASVKGELLLWADSAALRAISLAREELSHDVFCSESSAKLWCLDRTVFKAIMMKAGLEKQSDYVGFLRSVPLLKNLDTSKLNKIADAIEEDSFEAEQYIVREGETGNTFFIIKDGVVKVTQKVHGGAHPQLIRVLKSGDYFGEKALLEEERRTANCIAETKVEVLTLDRLSFIHLIGDLSEFKEKVYDENRPGNLSVASTNSDEAFAVIELHDLHFEVTLGMGGFGRVELVTWKANPDVTFALKCLKKQHIVHTRQQDHIYSEKNILMSLKSNFICKLYKTFKDRKYVYMLMEVCLGGELWTYAEKCLEVIIPINSTSLRKYSANALSSCSRGNFDEQFIMACVLEAFQHLHERGIIYRDLKPENLLLDHRGYVKLCDFGFAKKIGHGKKTWTFCGTPEYVSPEIILNKGHSFPADIWQIGVLLFELISGSYPTTPRLDLFNSPPFNAPDSMKIYNVILRGIEAVDFPASMSKAAQGLVKKLCRESPQERLGSGIGGIADIKKHKWFQGYDWTGLSRMSLVPPLSPKSLLLQLQFFLLALGLFLVVQAKEVADVLKPLELIVQTFSWHDCNLSMAEVAIGFAIEELKGLDSSLSKQLGYTLESCISERRSSITIAVNVLSRIRREPGSQLRAVGVRSELRSGNPTDRPPRVCTAADQFAQTGMRMLIVGLNAQQLQQSQPAEPPESAADTPAEFGVDVFVASLQHWIACCVLAQGGQDGQENFLIRRGQQGGLGQRGQQQPIGAAGEQAAKNRPTEAVGGVDAREEVAEGRVAELALVEGHHLGPVALASQLVDQPGMWELAASPVRHLAAVVAVSVLELAQDVVVIVAAFGAAPGEFGKVRRGLWVNGMRRSLRQVQLLAAPAAAVQAARVIVGTRGLPVIAVEDIGDADDLEKEMGPASAAAAASAAFLRRFSKFSFGIGCELMLARSWAARRPGERPTSPDVEEPASPDVEEPASPDVERPASPIAEEAVIANDSADNDSMQISENSEDNGLEQQPVVADSVVVESVVEIDVEPNVVVTDGDAVEPNVVVTDGDAVEPNVVVTDGDAVEPNVVVTDGDAVEPNVVVTDGDAVEPNVVVTDGDTVEPNVVVTDSETVEPNLDDEAAQTSGAESRKRRRLSSSSEDDEPNRDRTVAAAAAEHADDGEDDAESDFEGFEPPEAKQPRKHRPTVMDDPDAENANSVQQQQHQEAGASGGIITDIFGDSDQEDDKDDVAGEADMDEEFEGFNAEEAGAEGDVVGETGVTKPKKKRDGDDDGSSSSSGDEDQPPGFPVSDFDAIMQRKKEERRRSSKRSSARSEFLTDADSVITQVVYEMLEAAQSDRELMKSGRPATKKMKLLPKVPERQRNAQRHHRVAGPLSDGSLPSLQIRETLLRMLETIPGIDSDGLASSGLGKAVMYLYKHKRESRPNKIICGRLINTWSRPIFQLTDNYSTLTKEEREERDYANIPQHKRASDARSSGRGDGSDQRGKAKPGEPGYVGRARVPMPSNKDYVVRPKPRVDMDAVKLASAAPKKRERQVWFERHSQHTHGCLAYSSKRRCGAKSSKTRRRRSASSDGSAVSNGSSQQSQRIVVLTEQSQQHGAGKGGHQEGQGQQPLDQHRLEGVAALRVHFAFRLVLILIGAVAEVNGEAARVEPAGVDLLGVASARVFTTRGLATPVAHCGRTGRLRVAVEGDLIVEGVRHERRALALSVRGQRCHPRRDAAAVVVADRLVGVDDLRLGGVFAVGAQLRIVGLEAPVQAEQHRQQKATASIESVARANEIPIGRPIM
uniref:Fe2OG dioxygenase domain-containing protein n=1 Tax=Macrostomum lignano TaxID=282301 RepID=A0A1I8IEC4_9PLAT